MNQKPPRPRVCYFLSLRINIHRMKLVICVFLGRGAGANVMKFCFCNSCAAVVNIIKMDLDICSNKA